MKRFILLFFIYILTLSVTLASNESSESEILDNEIYTVELSESLTSELERKTLKEKILDIYSLEIEKIDSPKFLLSKHSNMGSL